MDKIKISKVDEVIYHEELDNGLNVYIYKKEGFVKKGAAFASNYGSAINDFKPIGEDKIRSFPKGIAHFLEHKLFESDEEKVFDVFSSYGADANAYTNHFITKYFFSTVNNFKECLLELIDFVQSPYFTDENVEKEKGIIYQEINMTNDNIYRVLFEETFNAALVRNPNKYKTIGDRKNVSKITKEDLYKCYNTFYHPSNMTLFIYGDIDVEDTINLVKENQKNKKFDKPEKIEIKEYEEDEKVNKEIITINRNIDIPRVMLCYKIKTSKLKGVDKFKKSLFASMLLDIKFGGASSFENDLLKQGIIEDNISYTFSCFDDVLLLFVGSKTKYKDKYIKIIDDKLKEQQIDKKIFELNKKTFITSIVKAYENPSMVESIIVDNINRLGTIIDNAYDIYTEYKYDDFISEFNNLNLDNKSVVVAENSDK